VPTATRDGALLGEECGEVVGPNQISVVGCAAPNVCEGQRCQAVVPAGGACASDRTPCETGYVCWPDSPDEDADATCKRITVTGEEGADCLEVLGDPASVYCNPVLLLGCKDGKCARIGDGSQGSTCFNDQDPRIPCDDGLHCDDASSSCAPQKGAGAPCERDRECLSDFCNSDGETSSCLGSQRCP
jgi:hypothetical protein